MSSSNKFLFIWPVLTALLLGVSGCSSTLPQVVFRFPQPPESLMSPPLPLPSLPSGQPTQSQPSSKTQNN